MNGLPLEGPEQTRMEYVLNGFRAYLLPVLVNARAGTRISQMILMRAEILVVIEPAIQQQNDILSGRYGRLII